VSANAGDELVDVVDEHDRVIRTVTRREMRAGRLLHRATSIAVFGTDGRLLVHRRAVTKDIWPGRWDIAAGGVVSAGEEYLASARRELAEELGIDDPDLVLVDLGGGRYTDPDADLFMRCFRCTHDGPFRFTDGEVSEVRWVTRDELERLLATETFVADNPAVLLPLLRWP
jgi:isopentenyldiphosphate isomerase